MTDSQEQRIIAKCGKVERSGLYIMVFVCFLHACERNLSKEDVRKEVEKALAADKARALGLLAPINSQPSTINTP